MDDGTRYSDDEARWEAVLRRDPRADGLYVYAVESTGVYCRPTCPSRRPKRENVTFFESSDAAEEAGFRPCKRCGPDRDLGMTPGAYRKGGEGITIRYTLRDTPLGRMLLAATDKGICALRFGKDQDMLAELRGEFPRATLLLNPQELDAFATQVCDHLDGGHTGRSARLRNESGGARGALSPGHPDGRHPGRLPVGDRAQALSAGQRGSGQAEIVICTTFPIPP